MLRLLIRKEIQEILRSRKFAVTFGVMSVLILLAFYSGALNYRTSLENYESAVEENRRQLDTVTKSFNIPWRVFYRPQPLQSVVSGVSNDVGRTAFINEWSPVSAVDSRFEEEPIYAVFRLLDLEFIISIALSLFAIMFAFDTITGEKERGTLSLQLSNPVPRDVLILGKLLGTFLALGVPMLIPILLGVLLLPLLGASLTVAEWSRLAIIVVAGGLYLGIFLCISALASSLTRRSNHSFLSLLAIWIIVVQIVPRLAGGVSAREVLVRTRASIVEEDLRLKFQHYREASQRIKTMHAEGVENPWSKHEEIIEELTERDAPIIANLEQERQNQLRHRTALALNLSRLSPTSVFRIAATELARTAPSIDEKFQAEAVLYRRVWIDFVKQRRPDWSTMKRGEADEPMDVSDAPLFHYRQPSLTVSVASALPDLALLSIYVIILFGVTVIVFRRYDVR